ncbi:radical SAM protein [Paenibacillus alvei]|uniref:SPL family radical SAM protein n=1 Tax=Paenibacillus TaxID=44249 RepID=UPI00028A1441|nr:MULTISPECIES: radical SAM protein [Paenibacillus]EJW16122.1 hypothetical protein PAV_6c02020 [Paenibacillus alvei DSM 29]MCY9541186.1 radical SAM protein [Paenibacillus alvei]MCY9704539.1 radical SAM protein [Paenibacillus alvei]MCY9732801.1 radical SAM protein [Paenibacillus alvei]MCY9754879.1 radical SAM protein [Paenibacillus alvei]
MEFQYTSPKSMLNKGTGFLADYTHTLNPYTGCSFACSYCYVRQMPVAKFRKTEWGSWVDIKQQAAEVLRKELRRAKAKGRVTIFMSSSTDPYQPVEYKERVTRSLLEAIVEEQPDFLLVQTRSPLVQRDIDLLQQMQNSVRVSMTIETDREDIRKYFTPGAPPIAARLKALERLQTAGIPTQATIAPVLPSSTAFPQKLINITERICIDDYFMGDGSGGARTRQLGISKLYGELGLQEWYQPDAFRIVLERFRSVFPSNCIYVSQKGFAPF